MCGRPFYSSVTLTSVYRETKGLVWRQRHWRMHTSISSWDIEGSRSWWLFRVCWCQLTDGWAAIGGDNQSGLKDNTVGGGSGLFWSLNVLNYSVITLPWWRDSGLHCSNGHSPWVLFKETTLNRGCKMMKGRLQQYDLAEANRPINLRRFHYANHPPAPIFTAAEENMKWKAYLFWFSQLHSWQSWPLLFSELTLLMLECNLFIRRLFPLASHLDWCRAAHLHCSATHGFPSCSGPAFWLWPPPACPPHKCLSSSEWKYWFISTRFTSCLDETKSRKNHSKGSRRDS